MDMELVKEIEKYGKESPGKKYYLRLLKGECLTMKQAILAKCFDCCGFYVDGKLDCTVVDCSLYPFMPYRKDKQKKKRTERQREAGQKLALFAQEYRRKR